MSTLKLENIKHENSSTNNMVMNSDGSVSTTGNASVGGTLGVTGVTTMSNNLGINSTPTAALDVRRTDANGKIAEFHQSSGYGLEIHSSQSRALMASGYLQDLVIDTDAGSGGVERMRITKEGRVTKPHQPSFSVNGTGGWQTVTSGNTTDIQLNTTHSNVSSSYNSGNYRFTAPVAGVYVFMINAYCRLETHDDDSNHAYIFLRKNGATYISAMAIYGYYNSGDVDQTQNVCCTMTMGVGDYATAALNAASGDASVYRGATTFSGFLMG